jgi:hypothetical protein
MNILSCRFPAQIGQSPAVCRETVALSPTPLFMNTKQLLVVVWLYKFTPCHLALLLAVFIPATATQLRPACIPPRNGLRNRT